MRKRVLWISFGIIIGILISAAIVIPTVVILTRKENLTTTNQAATTIPTITTTAPYIISSISTGMYRAVEIRSDFIISKQSRKSARRC